MDGLNAAVAEYDAITGGVFAVQESKLARTGDADPLRFPFAWSIRYLRKSLNGGVFDIDRVESRTSLLWVSLFTDVVGSWRHHPRFAVVANDLGKPESFLHTIAQLLAAKYLFQHGNWIGLSLEDKFGEPNPDLYIRGAGPGRVYLEVKAPRGLQTVDKLPTSLSFVESLVKRTIEKSSAQINNQRTGGLVVFSSLFDDRSPDVLERTVEDLLERRCKNRKTLAGVLTMCVVNSEISRLGGWISQTRMLKFHTMLNPHFAGPNPFNISDTKQEASSGPVGRSDATPLWISRSGAPKR